MNSLRNSVGRYRDDSSDDEDHYKYTKGKTVEFFPDVVDDDDSESSTLDYSSDSEIEADEDGNKIKEDDDDDDEENENEDEENENEDGESETEEEDDDDEEEADDDVKEAEEQKENSEEQATTSNADSNTDACPICLNSFVGQELGTPENCSHTFCFECIEEWAKKSGNCPFDRIEFTYILVRQQVKGFVIRKEKVEIQPREFDAFYLPEDTITTCEICQLGNREETLLLCDSCDLAYHCECLSPPLRSIPIRQWFCPTCSEILGKRPTAARGTQRVIPRTLVSETVRTRIQLQRTAIPDGDGAGTSRASTSSTTSRAKTVTPRKRKVRRYKRRRRTVKTTFARTKGSVSGFGKGRISTASAVSGPRRRMRRRRRRRKTTKRKSTVQRTKRSLFSSKRLAAPSTKERIASHLGLCKPPAGHTMPYTKGKKTSDQQVGNDPGSLNFFGNHNQLMDFDEDFGENESVMRTPARSALQTPAPVFVDVLGSIMLGQEILQKSSKDITIGQDGSLKLSNNAKLKSSGMTSATTVKTENSASVNSSSFRPSLSSSQIKKEVPALNIKTESSVPSNIANSSSEFVVADTNRNIKSEETLKIKVEVDNVRIPEHSSHFNREPSNEKRNQLNSQISNTASSIEKRNIDNSDVFKKPVAHRRTHREITDQKLPDISKFRIPKKVKVENSSDSRPDGNNSTNFRVEVLPSTSFCANANTEVNKNINENQQTPPASTDTNLDHTGVRKNTFIPSVIIIKVEPAAVITPEVSSPQSSSNDFNCVSGNPSFSNVRKVKKKKLNETDNLPREGSFCETGITSRSHEIGNMQSNQEIENQKRFNRGINQQLLEGISSRNSRSDPLISVKIEPGISSTSGADSLNCHNGHISAVERSLDAFKVKKEKIDSDYQKRVTEQHSSIRNRESISGNSSGDLQHGSINSNFNPFCFSCYESGAISFTTFACSSCKKRKRLHELSTDASSLDIDKVKEEETNDSYHTKDACLLTSEQENLSRSNTSLPCINIKIESVNTEENGFISSNQTSVGGHRPEPNILQTQSTNLQFNKSASVKETENVEDSDSDVEIIGFKKPVSRRRTYRESTDQKLHAEIPSVKKVKVENPSDTMPKGSNSNYEVVVLPGTFRTNIKTEVLNTDIVRKSEINICEDQIPQANSGTPSLSTKIKVEAAAVDSTSEKSSPRNSCVERVKHEKEIPSHVGLLSQPLVKIKVEPTDNTRNEHLNFVSTITLKTEPQDFVERENVADLQTSRSSDTLARNRHRVNMNDTGLFNLKLEHNRMSPYSSKNLPKNEVKRSLPTAQKELCNLKRTRDDRKTPVPIPSHVGLPTNSEPLVKIKVEPTDNTRNEHLNTVTAITLKTEPHDFVERENVADLQTSRSSDTLAQNRCHVDMNNTKPFNLQQEHNRTSPHSSKNFPKNEVKRSLSTAPKESGYLKRTRDDGKTHDQKEYRSDVESETSLFVKQKRIKSESSNTSIQVQVHVNSNRLPSNTGHKKYEERQRTTIRDFGVKREPTNDYSNQRQVDSLRNEELSKDVASSSSRPNSKNIQQGNEDLIHQIENVIKDVLKPLYKNGSITKEDYKYIMKKCVPKILKHSHGNLDVMKINRLVMETMWQLLKGKNGTQ